MTEADEWRRGWPVLLSSATGVGVGIPALINSAGLFVIPMQQEFGWSRSAIAIGPIVGLVYSLLNPLGGTIIDHYGARPAAVGGMILLVIALSALAIVPANPLAFSAILVSLGIVGTVTNNVVYCKAVATWFSRHAGTAIALVLSGVSVAGAIMQPLLALMIERYGWRMGYVSLAALALCIGLPMVLALFRERPDHVRARAGSFDNIPGLSLREAIRDRRFWLIVCAFGGAALPIGGFVNQLQPLLISKGYAPASAALQVSVFLLATGAGRLTAGFLFDRCPPAIVAASFLFLSALGALMLGSTDLRTAPRAAIAAAVALIGLAQGAEGDFIALFALRIFGLRNFSTLFATIAMTAGIGFAIGGFMFTAVFDQRGDYNIAILSAAGILLITSLVALTIVVPGRVSDRR